MPRHAAPGRHWLALAAAALLAGGCGVSDRAPPVNHNADRIGIVITGWGEPKGWDFDYRLAISSRARVGETTRYPGQSCTEGHVGDWPFASQIGLVPHAIAFKLPFLGSAWDAMGVYRRTGDEYVSIVDPDVRLLASEVSAVPGMVTPMGRSRLLAARSLGGPDPRDGRDYLEGVYQIGAPSRERGRNPLAMPNGLSDLVELSMAGAMMDMGFMYEDLTPRANAADELMTETAIAVLEELFGAAVEARFGAYAATPGVFPDQRDVALDMVEQGFTRLVLARETVDHNQYANRFMTRGWIEKALCRAGFLDAVEIKQTLQVGRTPEYNTMLLEILRPHLERRAPGQEIVIVYATYGMPFPGNRDTGPFATPQPLAAENFHENAYLNYQSFRHYAIGEFGDRLIFDDGTLAAPLRTNSYFAYAMFPPRYYGAPDDPLRFPTIREAIDRAKGAGHRDIVVLLSHWNYNNTDNMLAMRKINRLPYSSREDVRAGKYWIDWCESADGEDPIDCAIDAAARLTLSEVFDRQARAFGIGYGHRMRGTVERFGVLPGGVEPIATAEVTAADGGALHILDGPLAGVRLEVPADPRPGLPEANRWDDYEVFVDPADPFIGAWFDFEAYAAAARQAPGEAVGPSVLFGPYRTIVNKPARVTLPLGVDADDAAAIEPVIYNEVTRDWDPVYPVTGGSPVEWDRAARTISFDTQVLGIFAPVETLPGADSGFGPDQETFRQ